MIPPLHVSTFVSTFLGKRDENVYLQVDVPKKGGTRAALKVSVRYRLLLETEFGGNLIPSLQYHRNQFVLDAFIRETH